MLRMSWSLPPDSRSAEARRITAWHVQELMTREQTQPNAGDMSIII